MGLTEELVVALEDVDEDDVEVGVGERLERGPLPGVDAVVGGAFYRWLLARPPAALRGARRPGADQGWDWAGLLLLQGALGGAMAGLLAAGEHAAGAAPVQWGAPVVAALLFVAIGPSIVAYRCWGLGVAEGGPALAAFFSNLTPLLTALLSAVLLGELPQPYHAVAFALIVGGIALGTPRAAGLSSASRDGR